MFIYPNKVDSLRKVLKFIFWIVIPMFSSMYFIGSGLISSSLICFVLTLYIVWYVVPISLFLFLYVAIQFSQVIIYHYNHHKSMWQLYKLYCRVRIAAIYIIFLLFVYFLNSSKCAKNIAFCWHVRKDTTKTEIPGDL